MVLIQGKTLIHFNFRFYVSEIFIVDQIGVMTRDHEWQPK